MSLYHLIFALTSATYLVAKRKKCRKKKSVSGSLFCPDNNNRGGENNIGSAAVLNHGTRVATSPSALSQLIGQTPLVELKSLSKLTSNKIYVKCEYLNPGGSSKDRIAKQMVLEAERSGLLKKGGTIVEGTAGSTGISLSLMAASRGYKCHIVMPNDAAKEKTELLAKFGATVKTVDPASIVNDKHYNNMAKKIADATEGAFYTDQFENLANFRAHYNGTGKEIYEQTNGQVDAFVMGAGTGGTISGVGTYLKEKKGIENVKIILADPNGSVLYHRVKDGIAYAPQQAERKLERHRFDTITEGVGIDRLVGNFLIGEKYIDDAIRVTDQQCVDMAHYILHNEGIFIGSSSSLNCAAVVEYCKRIGPGHTIVTILCDGGQRHLTKFWNYDYLRKYNLKIPHNDGNLNQQHTPSL